MSERREHTDENGRRLFTPLGVHKCRCYFLTSQGLIVWYDAAQITRQGPALMLYPDMDHWSALYPGDTRSAANWRRAGADLISMAQAAGEYLPGPGEGSVNGSRLPYSPSERLAAYRLRQHDRKVSTLVARAERQAQRETPAG